MALTSPESEAPKVRTVIGSKMTAQVLVASLRALGRLVAALQSEALNLASLRLVRAS